MGSFDVCYRDEGRQTPFFKTCIERPSDFVRKKLRNDQSMFRL